MSDSDPALLSLRGIDKSFPGVKALQDVALRLRAGEVHALMGENGAGKSTLIKVLTGLYPRDAGSMRLAGQEISPASPRQAEALGISTVYQEVNLIPALSVAENICLGREPVKWGCIQWHQVRQRAVKALQRLGLQLDVTARLDTLPLALQQMVAIARALEIDAKVLVLDEPTSSLDEGEVEALFSLLRRLRGEGLGILLVTHFLDQVYAISDRITVLRNGRLVGEFLTAELPRLKLIGQMLGREPDAGQAAAAPSTDLTQVSRPVILETKAAGFRGGIQQLDLSLRAGQITGLAGLLGSGRTETARMLFGIDPATTGSIEIDGVAVPLDSPKAAIARGLAFCSEDRKREGIIPHLSVRENLILAMQAGRGPWKKAPLAQQTELAQRYIATLGIKTPSPETPIRNLSGGNQQKVLLARWLVMQPRLLILDEPTRGIDVGARAEIDRLIAQLSADGMAVLLISSELEEIVANSQSVTVLRDRRAVGHLQGSTISVAEIMKWIAHSGEEAA
ncbi:MAG: sugar ABC transporter ATP-binding protein [Verrucomicrobiales bacterium]|nr:sugar ABC transporter ATP-binding protein [Verrucomicrobiales bacterium]